MYTTLLAFLKQKKRKEIIVKETPVIEREPLKWKSLVPDNPSDEDFKEALKVVFGFYPIECVLSSVKGG